MTELEGIPKTLFEEVMDEIDEEIKDALEEYIHPDKIGELIKKTQENVADEVTKIIIENYSEPMSSVRKLILGEKLSRVVSKELKKGLVTLTNEIFARSLDLIDEMRNEIIGEVFEETE